MEEDVFSNENYDGMVGKVEYKPTLADKINELLFKANDMQTGIDGTLRQVEQVISEADLTHIEKNRLRWRYNIPLQAGENTKYLHYDQIVDILTYILMGYTKDKALQMCSVSQEDYEMMRKISISVNHSPTVLVDAIEDAVKYGYDVLTPQDLTPRMFESDKRPYRLFGRLEKISDGYYSQLIMDVQINMLKKELRSVNIHQHEIKQEVDSLKQHIGIDTALTKEQQVKIRNAVGMTQAEISEDLGISTRTVRRILNGK